MQKSFPDTGGDISPDDMADFTQRAQDKTCDLLKCGTDYVKENPLPSVLGALLIGAAIGALVIRREREQEADKLHTALQWIEDTYSHLADKIPQQKKRFFSCNQPSSLLEQAQDMGKKLKWW